MRILYKRPFHAALCWTLLIGSTWAGQVIHVDQSNPSCPGSGSPLDPFCTIQAGIDAASDGDEVVVAPGTYFENIDFSGKSILVRSTLGPSVTTINGGTTGAAVLFSNGEGPDTSLEGFTITSSQPAPFGFVGIESRAGASPTIRSNTITGNNGGGVRCLDGSVVRIIDNEIRDNYSYSGGAGISGQSSTLHIEGNRIESNDMGATSKGGGILLVGTDATIRSNTIRGNGISLPTTGSTAGGLYIDTTSLTIVEDNEILFNAAGSSGGVTCQSASTIRRNVIRNNTGLFGTGGLLCLRSSPVVEGNLISRNTGGSQGGGLGILSGSPHVVNNIIDHNSATTGGGLWLFGAGTQPILSNNTLAENIGAEGPFLFGSGSVFVGLLAQATIRNSIVRGASSLETETADGGVLFIEFSNVRGGFAGIGNIDADPLYLDANAGDFRIACNSPSVDAGTNTPGAPLPDLDHEGRDLRRIGTVDQGADEAGLSWQINGPAIVGGPPIDATAEAGSAQGGFLALLELSLGDGSATGGLPIPVPMNFGRRKDLDADALFNLWWALPSPVRQVTLAGAPCSSGTTAAVGVPPSAPIGLKVYYSGVSLDLITPALVSVAETRSIVTQ
ncbi:MAG: right-handed parallel beta-helix repeat-containing protein [Planctomycetota bacterium]